MIVRHYNLTRFGYYYYLSSVYCSRWRRLCNSDAYSRLSDDVQTNSAFLHQYFEPNTDFVPKTILSSSSVNKCLPEVDFRFDVRFAYLDVPSDLIESVVGLFFERRPIRRLLCPYLDPSSPYHRFGHRRRGSRF